MNRPIPTRDLYATFDSRPNLYTSLAERNRIERINAEARSEVRKIIWQGRVKAFCIAVAVLSAIYFGWQLGVRS